MSGTLDSRVVPVAEQRRGHHLEHAVLRARDVGLALQAAAPGDLELPARQHRRSRHVTTGLASQLWQSVSERSSTVHLTRIYTRTGDDGTTALGDMSRVPKTVLRVVGVRRRRRGEQRDRRGAGHRRARPTTCPVCSAGSRTSCSTSARTCARRSSLLPSGHRCGSTRVTSRTSSARATSTTDGSPASTRSSCRAGRRAAAALHVARTVARRAERAVWALLEAEPEATNPVCAAYLNRLSDLLFILGRVANGSVGDRTWSPREGRA